MSGLTAECDDLQRRAIYAYAFYNVLPGHALRAEGKPGGLYGYRGSSGAGVCECGEQSPELPSDAARKRWHAEHKNEIRGAAPALGRVGAR